MCTCKVYSKTEMHRGGCILGKNGKIRGCGEGLYHFSQFLLPLSSASFLLGDRVSPLAHQLNRWGLINGRKLKDQMVIYQNKPEPKSALSHTHTHTHRHLNLDRGQCDHRNSNLHTDTESQ